jgi:transposase
VIECTEVQDTRNYSWRTIERCQIVEESISNGRSLAEIGSSHVANANQLFDWHKQYARGQFGADMHDCGLMPVIGNGDSGISAWQDTHQVALRQDSHVSGKIRFKTAVMSRLHAIDSA